MSVSKMNKISFVIPCYGSENTIEFVNDKKCLLDI